MRILHVITRLIQGGAQQNTVMSCAAQVRAGHEVTLAFGPIYGPEGSLLEEAKASGARLVELRSMRRAVLPGRDVLVYRELRKLIRGVKPDIVHTHSSKAGIVGRAAAWAEKRSGRPVVIHTVHGLPFHDRQPRIVHGLYVALEKWAAKRCDHLVAITPAMVEAFVAKGIAPREKFTVIPSGVDIDKFTATAGARERARALLGLKPDERVLGIVARLDSLKGHDDLLDILPDLVRRVGELKLVFLGDGWNREHLVRRVKAEGHENRVVFTGLLAHEQVAEALPAFGVKALPSYQEGQSRTLIEALLCGCGIVAYDVGGIPSICIDGETGRLAPLGDKRALADAIVWMFEHPAERGAMVERGRELVRERFSAGAMVAQLEGLYAKLVHKNFGTGT